MKYLLLLSFILFIYGCRESDHKNIRTEVTQNVGRRASYLVQDYDDYYLYTYAWYKGVLVGSWDDPAGNLTDELMSLRRRQADSLIQKFKRLDK